MRINVSGHTPLQTWKEKNLDYEIETRRPAAYV